MMSKYATFAVVSVLLSIIGSIALIRLCVKAEYIPFFSITALVCGDELSATKGSFKRLQAAEVFIESNIHESPEFSLSKGNDASKIMDGSKDTLAAPASNILDYRIRFGSPQTVKQVIIYWKDFGINDNYIKTWSLEAMSEEGLNEIIQSGNRPRSAETVINKTFEAAGLRLTAESREDWIGVYEIEILARPR